MEIQLTPDQQAFVKRAIENGRFSTDAEAVEEALSLWEERERSRIELLAALDVAEADLLAGRYTDYTDETLPALFEEVKREGRAQRTRKRPG